MKRTYILDRNDVVYSLPGSWYSPVICARFVKRVLRREPSRIKVTASTTPLGLSNEREIKFRLTPWGYRHSLRGFTDKSMYPALNDTLEKLGRPEKLFVTIKPA